MKLRVHHYNVNTNFAATVDDVTVDQGNPSLLSYCPAFTDHKTPQKLVLYGERKCFKDAVIHSRIFLREEKFTEICDDVTASRGLNFRAYSVSEKL